MENFYKFILVFPLFYVRVIYLRYDFTTIYDIIDFYLYMNILLLNE